MKLTVLGQDDNAEVEKGCSAGSCGSTADQFSQLSPSIRSRVYNHPCYSCYSEQAHHHFARMHVAVAPACNIQCHYCNRKYDCTNESRPGVVSEVLTPEQAVKKTLAVAAKLPQLSVLGIAGPGDPPANPTRTFPTFRMLSEQAPDIKLCVPTNGLALPDCVEELARHNIEHVTITINCLDPEIGRDIYPWVFWRQKRARGRDAAAILIERQHQGLEMLKGSLILIFNGEKAAPAHPAGRGAVSFEYAQKLYDAIGAYASTSETGTDHADHQRRPLEALQHHPGKPRKLTHELGDQPPSISSFS